jgi:hypothetical protein
VGRPVEGRAAVELKARRFQPARRGLDEGVAIAHHPAQRRRGQRAPHRRRGFRRRRRGFGGGRLVGWEVGTLEEVKQPGHRRGLSRNEKSRRPTQHDPGARHRCTEAELSYFWLLPKFYFFLSLFLI